VRNLGTKQIPNSDLWTWKIAHDPENANYNDLNPGSPDKNPYNIIKAYSIKFLYATRADATSTNKANAEKLLPICNIMPVRVPKDVGLDNFKKSRLFHFITDNEYQELKIWHFDNKGVIDKSWRSNFNGKKTKDRGSYVYVVYRRCPDWSRITDISLFYETDDQYLSKDYYSTKFLPEYKKFGGGDIHTKIFNSNPREQVYRVALNDHAAEGVLEVLNRGFMKVAPYIKMFSYLNPLFWDKLIDSTVEKERDEIQTSGEIDGMPTRLVLHREYPIPLSSVQIYTQDAWFKEDTAELLEFDDATVASDFTKAYTESSTNYESNKNKAAIEKAFNAIVKAGDIAKFLTLQDQCPLCKTMDTVKAEKYELKSVSDRQACITVCYNALVAWKKTKAITVFKDS